MEIKDLQALYLSGTCCQMTGTRPLTVLNLDKRLYMSPEPHMKRGLVLYQEVLSLYPKIPNLIARDFEPRGF